MQKAGKRPFVGEPDRHAYILPSEIDYEGLCEVFLCCPPTIRYYLKAGVLKVGRKSKQKYVFLKSEAIKALTPFVIDGRLTIQKSK